MEATMKARSNPFASAAADVRGARRAIEQLVDDGALDSTADGIDPVTDAEVDAARATIPDRGRRP